MALRRIDDAVDRLLQKADVSEPPVPVELVAKHLAVAVAYEPFEGDLSGFLMRTNDLTLIGVNSRHPRVRQRFTVAHELGHYVVGGKPRSVEEGTVHLDRSLKFWLRSTALSSSDANRREETRANYFAAALLMPTRFLDKDLEKVEDWDAATDTLLRRLAKRYEVSTQALVIRLMALGHLRKFWSPSRT